MRRNFITFQSLPRRAAGKLGESEGSALILVALCMVLLMGSAALVADSGLAYLTQRRLQIAADAAALAAAADLPDEPAIAQRSAIDYAELNGVQITPSQVTIGPTFAQNDTVRVDTNVTVRFLFAPVLGIDRGDVAASGSARVGSLQAAAGLVPWGLVIPQGGFQFGTRYTLKSGTSGGGNFNALALGGTGADGYQDNIVHGSANTYRIGQQVDTEPGNMTGSTRSGLVERIGNDPHRDCADLVAADGSLLGTDDDDDGTDDDNPRLVMIPTITPPRPGRSTVTITGFAIFCIEGSPETWDGSSVSGMFVKDTVTGEIGPFSSNPLTPRVVALVG